jgi:hypothetical protein
VVWLGVACGVGLEPLAAQAQPTVDIRLYNTAPIGAADLAMAQAVASDIFQRAGTRIAWLDCSTPVLSGPCAEVPRAAAILVRIVPQPSPIKNALGGSLIAGDTHRGTLATIFATNVRAMALRAHADVAVLLGRAMAHEIGHVLLGTTAHSATGIMRPHWYDDELEHEKGSDWVLTEEDAWVMTLAADARMRGVTRDAVDAGGTPSGGASSEDALLAVAPPDDLTK